MEQAGIMSMQRICNYGSFLQAYGLKRIIEDLGCETEFVDYHPGRCLIKQQHAPEITMIGKALDTFRLQAPVRSKMRYISHKINFGRRYYPMLNMTEAMNYDTRKDVLVIGSDEVFNCVQSNKRVGFTKELFGKGSHASKVISYAASFGNTNMEKLKEHKIAERVKHYLLDLDAVSVRDENSRRIVEALTGRKPEVHLDPVLIYDFREEIPDIEHEVPYMILYGYNGRFTENECEKIKEYARRQNLKIYCIGGVQHGCDKFLDLSPFEVLAYFKHAKCVVTDTFHGCIFSIISHCRFAAFLRQDEYGGYGNAEKLGDLLERTNLSQRLVRSTKELETTLNTPLDTKELDEWLEGEKRRTKNYLRQQLWGVQS